MEIPTNSVTETERVGEAIGRAILAWPDAPHRSAQVLCIALRGGLGAGKTQLVRGLARGAATADPSLVSSPTYVLMNEYPAGPNGLTVWHLDAYRVAGPDDFAAIGFEDLLRGDSGPGIVALEWPERIEELLPPDRLDIEIDRGDHENERLIRLSALGKLAPLLQRLQIPPAPTPG
jgi:tRNA threonylcarbamoyladenosine biosynthesis protein TsaE